MDYVVMVDRSAGNAQVGEMWTETKVFPETATLSEIAEWLIHRGGTHSNSWENGSPEIINTNVRIASAQ